jgi:hypothetical protein
LFSRQSGCGSGSSVFAFLLFTRGALCLRCGGSDCSFRSLLASQHALLGCLRCCGCCSHPSFGLGSLGFDAFCFHTLELGAAGSLGLSFSLGSGKCSSFRCFMALFLGLSSRIRYGSGSDGSFGDTSCFGCSNCSGSRDCTIGRFALGG